MSGHTHIHTYIHTYIHTHTHDNYYNPRCAHAHRGLIIVVYYMYTCNDTTMQIVLERGSIDA